MTISPTGWEAIVLQTRDLMYRIRPFGRNWNLTEASPVERPMGQKATGEGKTGARDRG